MNKNSEKLNVIYVSYDSNFKKYAYEHGIENILYGLHPKTNKMFWVYKRDEKLDIVLQQWFHVNEQ